MIVVGVLTIIAFGVNVGFATKAVGTVDTWETVSPVVYGYVIGGIVITVLLMLTAWLVATAVGPSMSWILSLILSVFAFSTAFGALGMASITSHT